MKKILFLLFFGTSLLHGEEVEKKESIPPQYRVGESLLYGGLRKGDIVWSGRWGAEVSLEKYLMEKPWGDLWILSKYGTRHLMGRNAQGRLWGAEETLGLGITWEKDLYYASGSFQWMKMNFSQKIGEIQSPKSSFGVGLGGGKMLSLGGFLWGPYAHTDWGTFFSVQVGMLVKMNL